MQTLIKNGQVFYQGKLQKLDLLFDEVQILKAASHIEAKDARIVEADGLCVLPGLIDTHVHLRDPGYTHKETVKTGTMAAARGGFTTIFAMPNLNPFPSDKETMTANLEKIEKEAMVEVHPFGTITNNEQGKEPTDYAALRDLGICWFSDDGVGVADEAVMEEAMKKAAKADVLFSCHTEDMNYRKPKASVHESKWTKQKGWIGIPSACESEQLKRDLRLAKKTGVRYHADHISAKESVQALAEAKKAGADVSAEVTAHHLLLEDRDVQGPNWKMNPPLRSHEDRMALIEGLERGTLDFIASDHAPHTIQEKKRPMEQAPFGIVSLETSFPLLYTEFVSRQKRWSLGQLLDWMSKKPALRFGLEGQGEIKEGNRPDLFIARLNARCIIDKNQFASKGRNTPFDGWESHCEIMETYKGGRCVYKKDSERN